MKKLLLAGSVVIVLAGLLVAVAPARHGNGNGNGKNGKAFSAKLDGFQEVPSISTNGHGKFHAKVRNGSIEFTLRYRDLSSAVQAAHIHFAQEGVNGGVAAFLCGGDGKPACPPGPASGEVTGTITAADVKAIAAQGLAQGDLAALLRAMKHEATYVNVHTSNFAGGEIRGQIDRGRHYGNGHKRGKNGGKNGGKKRGEDRDDD